MQGGWAAKNASTFARTRRVRNTTRPDASAPCAWKTRFAMSNPIVLTCPTDASSSGRSTPPWHADAVRGRPSCTLRRRLVATSCKLARRANREFHQAERKLDELCTNLRDKTSTPKSGGPCDAAVLHSLPGVGTVTLATLLTEAAGPISRRDYAAL